MTAGNLLQTNGRPSILCSSRVPVVCAVTMLAGSAMNAAAQQTCDLIPGTSLYAELPNLTQIANGTISPLDALVSMIESIDDDCQAQETGFAVTEITATDVFYAISYVYDAQDVDCCDLPNDPKCKCFTGSCVEDVPVLAQISFEQSLATASTLITEAEASDAWLLFMDSDDDCDIGGGGIDENPISECAGDYYDAISPGLGSGDVCSQVDNLIADLYCSVSKCYDPTAACLAVAPSGTNVCSNCTEVLAGEYGLGGPVFEDLVAEVIRDYSDDTGVDLCEAMVCALDSIDTIETTIGAATQPSGELIPDVVNPLLVAEQLGALGCIGNDRSEDDEEGCGDEDGKDRDPSDSGCDGGGGGAASEGEGGRGNSGPGSPDCGGGETTNDPVTTTNADKRESVADLVIQVRGGSYSLTRSYNSAPPVDLYQDFNGDGTPTDLALEKPVEDWIGTGWDLANIRYIETWADRWTPALLPQVMKLVDPGQSSAYYYYDSSTPDAGATQSASGSGVWRYRPEGSVNQYLEYRQTPGMIVEIGSSDAVVRKSLRLVQPGSWEQSFDLSPHNSAEPDSELREAGRRYMIRDKDVYGNIRRYQWEFVTVPGDDGNELSQRPTAIYFNGNDDTDSEAWVILDWADPTHTDLSGLQATDMAFGGVLMSAEAYRAGETRPIKRVTYGYMVEDATDALRVVQANASGTGYSTVAASTDIGMPGDLVQVVHEELLNQAYSSSDYYTTVTQYRYHNGDVTSGSFTTGRAEIDLEGDGGDPDFELYGRRGQLKMLIAPQQIEFAAQRLNASVTEPAADAVRSVSAAWLAKSDDESLGVDNYVPAGIAAKLIGYETPLVDDGAGNPIETEGRVTVQYVSSGCGCGSATPGGLIRHTYERFTWEGTFGNSDNITLPGVTFRHTEAELDTSVQSASWGTGVGVSVLRVHSIDKVFLQYNDSLRSATGTPSSLGFETESGRAAVINEAMYADSVNVPFYVTHYEYDYDRLAVGGASVDLSRVLLKSSPSPTSTYTPAGNVGTHATNTPPSYSAGSADGTIELYYYDAEGRLADIYQHSSIPADLPADPAPGEHIYSISWGSGTGTEPGDATVANETAYGGDSDDLLTTYAFGYHPIPTASNGSQMVVNFDPDQVFQSIAWKKTKVTAPANGETMITYDLYNEDGENIWTIHPNSRTTYREFDPDHGAVTRITDLRFAPNTAHGGSEAFWLKLTLSDYPDLISDSDIGSVEFGNPNTDSSDFQTREMLRDKLGRVIRTTEGQTDTDAGRSTYMIRTLMTNDQRPGIPYYADVRLPHELLDGTGSSLGRYAGPAMITLHDAEKQAIRTSQYELNPAGTTYAAGGPEDAAFEYATDTEIARSTTVYSLYGIVDETRQWPHVDSTRWPGRDVTEYYATAFEYDTLGRVIRVIKPNGTFTRTVYDTVLGRRIRDYAGAGGGVGTLLTSYYYDGQTPGSTTALYGDGLLTTVRQHVTSDSTGRDTTFYYDFRGRQIAVENPLAPHSAVLYDNMGRVIQTAIYDDFSALGLTGTLGQSLISGMNPDLPQDDGRRQYSETTYNSLGQVYRTRTSFNPTAANALSDDHSLVSEMWYDEMGQTLAMASPNGQNVKTEYDWLSRPIKSFVVVDAPTVSTTAVSSADTVLSQTNTVFDDQQRLESTTSYTLLHGLSETGTGELDTNNAVPSYALFAYDDADRRIASIAYGANTTTDVFTAGQSAPSLPSQLSDLDVHDGTELQAAVNAILGDTTHEPIAQITRHNARGLVEDTIRPRDDVPGTAAVETMYVTRAVYDDLARRIATIENATDTGFNATTGASEIEWEDEDDPSSGVNRWVVRDGSSSPDQDRVTSMVYDSVGHTVLHVAHTGTAGSGLDDAQVTEYIYGSTGATPLTLDGSGLTLQSLFTTNDLLYEVRYPNETTGDPGTLESEMVRYRYNRRGERVIMIDQRDVFHRYTFDDLGRLLHDDLIGTLPTNVDGLVKGLSMTYTGFGQLETAASYDGPSTTGSRSKHNLVRFDYDDSLRILGSRQNNNGDEVSGTDDFYDDLDGTLVMHYADSGASGGNYSRATGMTYPNEYSDSDPADSDPEYDSQTTTTIDYGYGSGGANDSLSRVETIESGTSASEYVHYAYAGTGMPVIVDYAVLDLQLARDLSYGGTNGEPNAAVDNGYPGLDRFGRVKRHTWASRYDNSSPAPFDDDQRDILFKGSKLDIEHAYDRLGNRLREIDRRFAATPNDRDWWYEYDGLIRLDQSSNGIYDASPTPTHNFWSKSEDWTLDTLGNWDEYYQDLDADGSFTQGSGDEYQDRTHNAINEYSSATITPATGSSCGTTSTFDDAGNMTGSDIESGYGTFFKYDAWNRLVQVRRTEPDSPSDPDTLDEDYVLGAYFYDALGRRIRRDADTDESDFNGLANGERDQIRTYFWSPSWQLLEEKVILQSGTDASGDPMPGSYTIDRYGQQVWGIRYIDDAVAKRLKRGSNPVEEFWYVTDAHFSVRSVHDSGGLIEEIDYTPYGVAEHHLAPDVATDATNKTPNNILDLSDINTFVTDFQNDASAHADPGHPYGVYDLGDTTQFNRIFNGGGGSIQFSRVSEGQVSSVNDTDAGPDSSVGYAGYIFDSETLLYNQRHRAYATDLGRWMQRDPLINVDGNNLYAYTQSSPIQSVDPLGLFTYSILDLYISSSSGRAKLAIETDKKICGYKLYTPNNGYQLNIDTDKKIGPGVVDIDLDANNLVPAGGSQPGTVGGVIVFEPKEPSGQDYMPYNVRRKLKNVSWQFLGASIAKGVPVYYANVSDYITYYELYGYPGWATVSGRYRFIEGSQVVGDVWSNFDYNSWPQGTLKGGPAFTFTSDGASISLSNIQPKTGTITGGGKGGRVLSTTGALSSRRWFDTAKLKVDYNLFYSGQAIYGVKGSNTFNIP